MSWLLDPNLALLGFVGLTCLIAVLRTFAMPRSQAWEVRALIGIVAAIGGATYAFAPHAAGYAATAAWLGVVLAPGLVSQEIVRRVYQRQYRRAARLARVLAVLRPRSGWRGTAAYYDALETLRLGRRDQGLVELAAIAQGDGGVASAARAEQLVTTGGWRELRQELEARPDGFELTLLPRYVRALGELGEPARMLASVERVGSRLDGPSARWVRYPMLLFVFAFAGRPERVAELLDGPLRHFDAPSRALWLATSELAHGDMDAARARLKASYAAADRLLAQSFDKRLADPPPIAATALDDAARRTLARLERDWDGERRYAPDAGDQARPVVTWALVAAVLAVYALEVAKGGATRDETLLALGALAPDLVAHQPWRILTAQFLHYGPVHLGANVIGLMILGGFAERALGKTRYLIAYFLSGTLALGAYVVLARVGITAPEMLIGASGNIMGIVGASAAIVAHGWWLERARAARRHLTLIVMIVVLQAIMDLTVPGTSFAAHALGAAFGFIIVAPMVGVPLGRVALIGVISIALSVAGERVASRKARLVVACQADNFAACEQSCQAGVAALCEGVARVYEDSDPVRARQYFEMARKGLRDDCDDGEPSACRGLAHLVVDGHGTPDDARLVREAMDKQCSQDHDRSACRLLQDLPLR